MTDYADTLEKAKENLLVGASPRRYICEIHREIYDLLEKHLEGEELEKGLDLLSEAFYVGKKMSDRLLFLKDFKEIPVKGSVPLNANYQEDIVNRAARRNLLSRIHSLQIQTIDYCNLKCSWCPNSKMKKSPETLMSSDTLARILRQLVDYNYKGEIHPFLMGEPTMDKRLPQLVKIIKNHLPENVVKIITNGTQLRTKESLDMLFESGVDKIHMNHYSGPFSKITKARDSYYDKLSHFGLPFLEPSFYNRGGNIDCEPADKKDVCDWFLHKLYFRHNGDLILCCSDYNYEVVFGNIMEQPLAMILASEKYREYYYAHKEGRGKEMPLCNKCNRIK
jgi:radical SAM protein with 4Fe4S-binding SPASM domain